MKLLLSQAPQVTKASGEAISLASRDAAVLAWLALEGPTSRTRLITLLWPDSDAEAARNSLRQRLHQLRKAVGADLICGDATLALAEGVGHDLQDSETVLGHAAIDYSPEFSTWLGQQRERRTSRLRRALSELADKAERSHDHLDALFHAQELLTLEPQSEAAHRRLMRLHYLRGDRAAALLAFDRCEQVLKDDVGARPSTETLALLATIERAGPDATLQPAFTVPAALQRPPRLIGRNAERQALVQAVSDGAVLLLSGQAGMGKSRLIAGWIESDAAQGSEARRFVSVCARPDDKTAPHGVLMRLLRGLTLCPGVELDATQRSELVWLLPELGPPSERTRPHHRARQLGAMRSVLEAAMQQGLRAVIVDDLQYADAASVEWLQALAGNPPCAWIIAMRPDELDPAAQALFEALAASTTTHSVSLQPLGDDAIALLLDSLDIEGIGGVAQARMLRQRTGGNPMFLLETLKAALAARSTTAGATVATGTRAEPAPLAWPGAQSVQRLIQQRLTKLDPLALKLVRCAALAGQDFSSSLAAEVLRLQPLDLADAWRRLEEAQVLHDGAFAHDLIAEAALGLVPAAIARTMHAEIGRILGQCGAPPARVAAHWLAAGEPSKAAPHLMEAARRAHAAWRRAEAATLYQQAAAILQEAGDRRGAFDAYFAAAEAASQSVGRVGFAACGQALLALADDDGQRAAAALVPAAILLEERKLDTVRRLALEALPQAQRADLPDIEVELLWDLTMVHLDRHEMAEAVQRVEQALARLPAIDPATARLKQVGTRFKLVQALGTSLSATCQYAKSDEMLLQALQQARQDREWAYIGFVANTLAGNALDQGDLEKALDWSAQSIADEDRFDGGLHERVSVGSGRAAVLELAGDLGGALAAAEGAVRLCERLMLRIEPRTRQRLHTLQFELGRRDLAVKGLRGLRDHDDLRVGERLTIEAELLRMGDTVEGAPLVERAAAIDDFPLRVRILCLLQPVCDPGPVLPLLGTAADTARTNGAHGLWLTLQTRRLAALRTAGRLDEARAQALTVWQRAEEGIVGLEMFPRMAAELCAALAPGDADLAQVIALRASAWMHRAAATLPPAWRENYLTRAPMLHTLWPAASGALFAPVVTLR